MGAAIATLTLTFAALVLRPADADAQARDRARALAAVSLPTASAALPVSRPLGPSVLAQRSLRPSLPALLRLPADIAETLPAGSPEAVRAVQIAPSETSQPTVYRLGDGRLFVLQRTLADRGRPALVNWFEEGTVRGRTAQVYSSPVGPFRALVWWTEGSVSYYLYSSALTTRELLGLTSELR